MARINACALTTAYDPSFSPRLSTPLAWGARRVQWPHAPPFEGRLAPRQSIQKRKKGKEKEKKREKAYINENDERYTLVSSMETDGNPITENDNTLQNISSGVVVIRCNEARITRLFSSTMLLNSESFSKY